MRTLRGLLIAAVLPVALSAQDESSPWDAFLGCWTAVEESASPALSCYLPVPGDPQSAEHVMLVQNLTLNRARFTLDGLRHDEQEGSCSGYQLSASSQDQARVYLRSRMLCGAAETSSDGVLSLSPRGELLRVYLVGTTDRRVLMSERLRRVETSILPAAYASQLQPIEHRLGRARRAASALINAEQIVEVATVADVTIAEAWIVESTRGIDDFRVSRRELERLVDRGVNTRVVDMLVAVSNPTRFSPDYDQRPPTRQAGGGTWMSDAACFQRLVNNQGTLGFGLWNVFAWNSFPMFGVSDCVLAGYYRSLPFWAFGPGGVRRFGVWDPWGMGYFDPNLVPTRVLVNPGTSEFGSVSKRDGYGSRNQGQGQGTATPRTPAASPSGSASSSATASDRGSSGGRSPSASGSGTGRTAQPRTPREPEKP